MNSLISFLHETPEEKSPVKSAWSKIDAKATETRKQSKGTPFRSKNFRHPEESPKPISALAKRRKAAALIRIENLKKSQERIKYFQENPTAKLSRVKGEQVVIVRENGKFTGKKVVF